MILTSFGTCDWGAPWQIGDLSDPASTRELHDITPNSPAFVNGLSR